MLSMGHVLIPQSDLWWSKQTDVTGFASFLFYYLLHLCLLLQLLISERACHTKKIN
jgi:hypothetical protein